MNTTQELTADKLKVKILSTRQEMGALAAKEVAATIRLLQQQKDNINIIFAAAPSQNEFLDELSKQPNISWNRVNGFHMDEYIGLNANAPQLFGHFLKKRIFDKVPFRNVYYINGNANSPQNECERYAALLQQFPADIVCMGIGENGHIAFNDPHVADFNDPALIKPIQLAEESRIQQVNDGCFATIAEVPTIAVTLTIPALVNAAYVYCMVPATTKADAVYNTLHSKIEGVHPSTILRKHDHATLYLDKDSAARLNVQPSIVN